MMENERSTAINPGEAVEEKVSLSDRFGLWLGFHKCSQDEYLDMVVRLCATISASTVDRDGIRRRGAGMGDDARRRSGRTAWQFIQDLAGPLGQARLARLSDRLRREKQRHRPCRGRRRPAASTEPPV